MSKSRNGVKQVKEVSPNGRIKYGLRLFNERPIIVTDLGVVEKSREVIPGIHEHSRRCDEPNDVTEFLGNRRLVQFGLVPNRLSHKASQLTDLAPQTQ